MGDVIKNLDFFTSVSNTGSGFGEGDVLLRK